jgi:ferrous iron transport protein B
MKRAIQAAIIGNPNTGKSTLFNALTGMQARVGNFAGVTVEKKVGRVQWDDVSLTLIDLPGTYSLSPRSLDEMVAVDVLLGRQADTATPDVALCIVDAANLQRHLYLFSQLMDLDIPLVLILNMMDVAEARGITIDVPELEARLGVPVVTTQAHRRTGISELRKAILRAVDGSRPESPVEFPASFCDAVHELSEWWKLEGDPPPKYLLERMILDVNGQVEQQFAERSNRDLTDHLAQIRDELRQREVRIPAVEAMSRYAWARGVLEGVISAGESPVDHLSDRLDQWVTHRWAGVTIFVGLMFLVFQAIYHWAQPLMGVIESGQALVGDLISSLIPPGALRSLLVDGVVAGVGGVLVFLPQICLLFFFIAIFEDCGYLARAAFLMDKLMTRLGLSGKSFVPLMSSFACAIPGIMATRVIENRRDRMITILVAPLMSCSARLPVYLLLIGAFVPATHLAYGVISLQGVVLFAMMSLGAVVAVPVAWILKKTYFRGETPPFVMELPSYKWPSPRIVFGRVYDRGRAFVVRAGTLIFATAIVVWGAGYFPADHSRIDAVTARVEQLEQESVWNEEVMAEIEDLRDERNQLAADLISASFLGQLGQVIEPVVIPLGWDWRIGVGVLASFPAREVIIATLGTVYSLGGEVEEGDDTLSAALQQATWPDGRPVYTTPVAVSIMVFFALCAQCASTLMVMRRETNSYFWPMLTFVYMTTLAYLAAWLTFQIGSSLF